MFLTWTACTVAIDMYGYRQGVLIHLVTEYLPDDYHRYVDTIIIHSFIVHKIICDDYHYLTYHKKIVYRVYTYLYII